MNRIGVLFLLTVASVFGQRTPEYNLLEDSRGAPRLVIKGSALPLAGSFWAHFTGFGNEHQVSVASVDVNGAVKDCIIDLNGTNFSPSDWHFFKWILRSNEFSCIFIGSDHVNLTSAPVHLVANGTSKDRFSYTILPGAGNSDFCLANVTVGHVQALDCVRVKKTSSATVLPNAANQTCDCPVRPVAILRGHVFEHLPDEETPATEFKTDLKSNRVTAADDRDRWRNSSSWQINFPTPKPFIVGFSRETTTSHSTSKNGTSTRIWLATKSVARVFLGSNETTWAPTTTASTPRMTHHANLCDISSIGNTCHNGGVCVQNVSDPDHHYCNCTSGFHGDLCEFGHETENVSRHTSAHSDGFKCPEDFCHNGATCWSNILRVNDSAQISMPNFSCICTEEYTGQRCTQPNPCYSTNNPCLNGATCSLVVNLGTTNRSLFQCQCLGGFDGERCEIRLTPTIHSTTEHPEMGPVLTTTTVANITSTVEKECTEGEKDSCKNGATCSILDQKAVCKCLGNFTGVFCENGVRNAEATGGGSSSNKNVGAIVGGVLGALAFVGLIIGSVFLYRYIQKSRKLKGKYNPAKEEMTATSGNSMSMTTVTTGERLI